MKREIYFAGGCFWGLQKYFDQVPGVLETEVGYANSRVASPTYQQVCTGQTNATETVRVVYDDTKVSLEKLLELFVYAIDPTSLNRQGNDKGTQYRTGVYATDERDTEKVRQFLSAQQALYDAPIVVERGSLKNFWRAEEYHQKYLDKNPGGYCHIGKEAFDYARGN